MIAFSFYNFKVKEGSNDSNDNLTIEIQLKNALELVLGCAINCERKQEFINNIMEMNEDVQTMLYFSIKKVCVILFSNLFIFFTSCTE